jgi:hypothetical protein
LHENAVEPAPVLESNILQNTNVAKSGRIVQPDRGRLLGGIADHRDHLSEAECRCRLDQRRQQLCVPKTSSKTPELGRLRWITLVYPGEG